MGQSSLGFWHRNESPNFGHTTRPSDSKKRNQRTYWIVKFAVQADHRMKLKVGEKKNKYLDLVKELKKIMDHESDGDTNCNKCTQDSHERFGTGTGGLWNKRTSGDHPNYSIVKIGQNTEKSPGHLQRLAVTPVKNNQLTLVWKTFKGVNNNNDKSPALRIK